MLKSQQDSAIDSKGVLRLFMGSLSSPGGIVITLHMDRRLGAGSVDRRNREFRPCMSLMGAWRTQGSLFRFRDYPGFSKLSGTPKSQIIGDMAEFGRALI